MKRKTPNGLIAKWKDAFSKEKTPISVTRQKRSAAGNKGASLALIKKEPVTFRLTKSVNPKDFELMSFVIRACAKAAANPVMTVLHVEETKAGSCLVACDGLRLHAAEISQKIKSGNYKFRATKDAIILGKPVKNVKFPVLPRMIPEKTEKRGVINLEQSGLGRNMAETEKLSLAFNSLVSQTGETVNVRYLEDLTKRKWAVYSQDRKHRALVLIQEGSKVGESAVECPVAVIVPIPKAA